MRRCNARCSTSSKGLVSPTRSAFHRRHFERREKLAGKTGRQGNRRRHRLIRGLCRVTLARSFLFPYSHMLLLLCRKAMLSMGRTLEPRCSTTARAAIIRSRGWSGWLCRGGRINQSGEAVDREAGATWRNLRSLLCGFCRHTQPHQSARAGMRRYLANEFRSPR